MANFTAPNKDTTIHYTHTIHMSTKMSVKFALCENTRLLETETTSIFANNGVYNGKNSAKNSVSQE